MNAIATLNSITARNSKAETAKKEFFSSIPEGVELTAYQSGSQKNQVIEFRVNGKPFYTHYVRRAGYFHPMTSPRLADMQEALSNALA